MSRSTVHLMSVADAELLARVAKDHDETVRRPRPAQEPVQAPKAMFLQFRVITVHDDYLTCKRVVADAQGQTAEIDVEVAVAKPYALRRTPFDGQTKEFADGSQFSWAYASQRKRTATRLADGDENVEVMTPDYIATTDTSDGEIITALRVPTSVLDADGNRIHWEEWNQTARAWATEAT